LRRHSAGSKTSKLDYIHDVAVLGGERNKNNKAFKHCRGRILVNGILDSYKLFVLGKSETHNQGRNAQVEMAETALELTKGRLMPE